MSPKDTTTTSITTTTSTTTTSTTPVKIVEKNNCKVEEMKETTTTTTKTTTIVTPIKEDAKKKNIIRNRVWSDKHHHCAQLTRDFALGRYDAETKATEIHGDPEREYSQYNLQTIQRKAREIRLYAKAYHKGVWLSEDPLFTEQCKLHVPPNDEEKKGREEAYRRFAELQRDVEDVLGGLGNLEL